MLSLHPEFIEKDGRRESVVLPYEEYEALVRLAEARDAELRETDAEAVEVEELEAEAKAEAEEAEPFLRL